ncbi:MAG: hypothetical protein Q9166_006126 [cf. Caloplaca sp. 2 TL-2023]
MVSVPRIVCYYNNGTCTTDQNQPPEIAQNEAHGYGELTHGALECWYTTDNDIFESSQDFQYFQSSNSQQFAYRFSEYNPNDRSQAYPYSTNRLNKTSPGQCDRYTPEPSYHVDSTDGPESKVVYPFSNGTNDDQIAVSRPDTAYDSTTYASNGSQAPQNTSAAACGPRCIWLYAIRHNGTVTRRGIDVSEIIYNASKGSKFFNNEEHKDKNLTQKIEKIRARKRQLERTDLTSDLRRADEYIAELELSRDLSQTVVHVDCDAFYAAVEELDHPELKHVPMAVGKGVLTTCNYHARKYGCRSGMAGFVAMKLCPQLICLPLNFEKYTKKAQEVREVLARYDPRYQSASMDEAYMNITQYCADHEMNPDEAVSQLRAQVFERAKITVSAGVAANARIAKIASNRNKPNGQFRVASDRATILAFMRDLPTRKINGVGRVFERELEAVGVKTCGDIYAQRAFLSRLFGEKAFHFLMQVHLGLGHTSVRPAEEYERKSVGTESTFRDMSGKEELRAKLRWIAEELEKDLARTQHKGRTLVLKVKLHTYEVLTRQVVPPKAVSTADDLYAFALPMLQKLEREIPGMKLRLMGLRCTHLVSTKKEEVDFFGLKRPSPSTANTSTTYHQRTETDANGQEWEVWPEDEFEAAAREEREAEFNRLEKLSQEYEQSHSMHNDQSAIRSQQKASEEADRRLRREQQTDIPAYPKKEYRDNGTTTPKKPEEGENSQIWHCPICGRPQVASDRDFNEHVDYCLSKQTIRDAVQTEASSEDVGHDTQLEFTDTATNGGGSWFGAGEKTGSTGRGKAMARGKRKAEKVGRDERRTKKLFFG